MAQEAKRGCGYRKVGGIYLVADGLIAVSCDALPFAIRTCPTCGETIPQSRALKRVDPIKLFWNGWDPTGPSVNHPDCHDPFYPCKVCQPAECLKLLGDPPCYLAWVGAKFYTASSFTAEAARQGVSKRIGHVPHGFIVGKSIVYLAHPKASVKPLVVDGEEPTHSGIFAAFIPKAIEMPVWRDELTEEKKAELAARGITAVPLERDPDHAPDKDKESD